MPESSDGVKSFVMELLSDVLVMTIAFDSEVSLRSFGTEVEVGRGFLSQTGRRTGVVAPVRRLDGRGGRTLDSADTRRVPNLALANDSLPYVLILDGGPLRTPP